MARITDRSKIIKIQEATIKTVVDEGIKNASVAKITKQAEVSMGYLYRFYLGKDDLIRSIFKDLFKKSTEHLSLLLKNEKSLKIVITKFISNLFEQANNNPNHILFLLKLMTDYSFRLTQEDKDILSKTCKNAIELGHKTKEINNSITPEILYTIIIGTTFFFINSRERNIFSASEFNEDDVQLITEIYMKALA
ncbi:TetR/AcrR family transcriptional regulator [Ornithobacterium rhinotracheale]|uniref:TetR/AcrR family transcriptional regulator n=1 Tax=Ornithobacterium rhinotracheale TaxID=28251 RepID=UPI001629455E|nr:TetR/AcrR family transcriptional regulator [Ornithobacterium rhinotracheale]UOH78298.1 TetR/AcrR family transcriptional regulator [Ornithobacterium rhinotracheale]